MVQATGYGDLLQETVCVRSAFRSFSKETSDCIHVVSRLGGIRTVGPGYREPALTCVSDGESGHVGNPPVLTTGRAGATTRLAWAKGLGAPGQSLVHLPPPFLLEVTPLPSLEVKVGLLPDLGPLSKDLGLLLLDLLFLFQGV